MDIASMNGITAEYLNQVNRFDNMAQKVDDTSFQSVLSAAKDMVNETNY